MKNIPIQIRPSDHDSLGHVNNANYVAYVQHVVAEWLSSHGVAAGWRDRASTYWMMQELAIEYRLASSYGDRLFANVWPVEYDEGQPVFGSEIYRLDGETRQVIARSRSRWQQRRSSTDEAVAATGEWPGPANAASGDLPRPFKAPVESKNARRYRWQRSVERSEIGPGNRIHPHVLFEWIEEATLHASTESGWPIERYLAEDFIVFQMRHDASINSLPVLGEVMEVTSRMISARRLRGTWHNEIRSQSDGRLLATNHSTGVFLNLDGRPTSPPPGLIEALQGLAP
jgi:acyl-CoA thioesterase FadM